MKEILQYIQNSTTSNKNFDAESIIEQYPFFQSLNSVYLKELYNKDSFKYNSFLKNVAAHTVDRTVLFEYISDVNFSEEENSNEIAVDDTATQETIKEKLQEVLEEKAENSVKDEFTEELKETLEIEAEDTVELEDLALAFKEVKNQAQEEEITIEETKEEIVEETIIKEEVNKPLEFSKSERHSFNQWLQLKTTPQPIVREFKTKKEASEKESSSKLDEKLDLIDQFIQNSPRISPVKKTASPSKLEITTSEDMSNQLMTETLAKVYVAQEKYDNAIQAYKILSLKYPEKNSFFADQIKKIKKLKNS